MSAPSDDFMAVVMPGVCREVLDISNVKVYMLIMSIRL
ncbi:MAG: hypothetical protein ETSY2_47270 [Candidatus Entotheonella gemina]|uniref:Uncharacterized protein n=1 Tax=Candidatus Entotheonella gemina TaxID=1429439 RepID=W4LD26_9BACT|nr:MAG: hypothetical protein ETSY2_47270 [Candidatus Entotheonella gemina]